MTTATITRLVLTERARRIAGLIIFAILFIASGLAARAVAGGNDGHIEMDQIFQAGGYPLVSALLLMGWLLGRFPIIATLVLLAGVFSADRAQGYARVYGVRPVSFVRLYGVRCLILLATAFALNAILLPVFDVIMLGAWNGPSTLVLIACYVIVYGGLVTLLSVFTRGEAWIGLALAIAAMVWDALRRADVLAQAPPGIKEAVSFILPPQGPLFRIETAFGEMTPMPWIDVAYVCGYGLVLLLAAAVFVADREV